PTYWMPSDDVNVSDGAGAKPAVAVSKMDATSGEVTIQLHPPRSVFRWTTLESSTTLMYKDSYFSLIVSPRAVLKSQAAMVPALFRRSVRTSRSISRLIS